jgi:hypothetical protein
LSLPSAEAYMPFRMLHEAEVRAQAASLETRQVHVSIEPGPLIRDPVEMRTRRISESAGMDSGCEGARPWARKDYSPDNTYYAWGELVLAIGLPYEQPAEGQRENVHVTPRSFRGLRSLILLPLHLVGWAPLGQYDAVIRVGSRRFLTVLRCH